MKEYVVTRDLLLLAKELVFDWTTHEVHCSYHTVDVCDCGLASLKRRYKEECDKIKEFKMVP
jgi:hypothetical protein